MRDEYSEQIEEYSDMLLVKFSEGRIDKPTCIRLLDKLIEWKDIAEKEASDCRK